MLKDSELIEGCRRGQRAFQKALYDFYCHKMKVVCLRYSKSTNDAEDILQEGFVKVFRSIENFRGESSLSTWMTRIMVNTALNHYRKSVHLYRVIDVNEIDLPDTEVNLSGFHFIQLLEMIQSLPSGCQQVFNLYAIEGYAHKEIAQMLQISEGTSKSQYARAKQLLREKLTKDSNYLNQYGKAEV